VTTADVCEISGDAGGERNYHQRANEKRKFEMTLNWIWRPLSRARLASAGRSITRALIISSKQRQIASLVHHENENEQIAFALANKGDRTPAACMNGSQSKIHFRFHNIFLMAASPPPA
jgi:hypothetical protein